MARGMANGATDCADGPLRQDGPGESLMPAQLLIQPLGEGAKVRACLTKSRVFLEQLVDRLAAMLVGMIRWLVDWHKPLRPFH